MKTTPIGLWLKQHHMRHHYQTDDLYYGVSTPLNVSVGASAPSPANVTDKNALFAFNAPFTGRLVIALTSKAGFSTSGCNVKPVL